MSNNQTNGLRQPSHVLDIASALSDIYIRGLSLSGQMHSLVVLDSTNKPLRNAILWNDTRSTHQCTTIEQQFGDYILSNPVLEGFTLTKLLWKKIMNLIIGTR